MLGPQDAMRRTGRRRRRLWHRQPPCALEEQGRGGPRRGATEKEGSIGIGAAVEQRAPHASRRRGLPDTGGGARAGTRCCTCRARLRAVPGRASLEVHAARDEATTMEIEQRSVRATGIGISQCEPGRRDPVEVGVPRAAGRVAGWATGEAPGTRSEEFEVITRAKEAERNAPTSSSRLHGQDGRVGPRRRRRTVTLTAPRIAAASTRTWKSRRRAVLGVVSRTLRVRPARPSPTPSRSMCDVHGFGHPQARTASIRSLAWRVPSSAARRAAKSRDLAAVSSPSICWIRPGASPW